MATQGITIGTVGITGHLLINARKASDPGTVVDSKTFAPSHPPFRNISWTGLDAEVYYFDFRESPDGVALGTLFATREVNVKDQTAIQETRYYRAGGVGANDPAPYQDTVTDTYLDGKTISHVYRDAISRPLFPPSELTKEYDLVTGGGIKMLNGYNLSEGEGVVIIINLLADVAQPPVAGIYNGVVTLTANTTLNSTHFNKRLRCESSGSSRQVNTMPVLAGIPEETIFYFMQNGGNQFQTRLLTQGSDLFRYFDSTYNELTIAPGEFLWCEVRVIASVKYFEVVQAHAGVLQVGERFSASMLGHPNTKPEDGALYDGDDYPRPWWWINNRLPIAHRIIDDNVVNPGYVHPVGKEGLFVMHSTLKKFRVPNSQGLADKAIKNFNAFGTDVTRLYDYPGGKQNEGLKPFDSNTKLLKPRIPAGGGVDGWSLNNAPGSDNFDLVSWPAAVETSVNNLGWVYLRRF
jgi:hypothetical protein